MHRLNTAKPPLIQEFEDRFNSLVIGQPDASRVFAAAYGRIKAQVSNPRRPKRIILLAGPTGVGKSRAARIFNYITKGNEDLITVACDSFVHEGYAARIVGSPVGYRDSFGGNEREPGVEPILSQSNVDRHASEEFPATILIDEVEKGGLIILNLLLGITEDGKAQLGNGSVTDMTNTLIVITTNAGAREMQSAFNGKIGFIQKQRDVTADDITAMKEIAMHALKKAFLPEFLNRVDDIVIALPLDRAAVAQVRKLEISALQCSLLAADPLAPLFSCTNPLEEYILEKGFSKEYGARNMRKAVDDTLSPPLINIRLNGELNPATHFILFDLAADDTIFAFADDSIDETEIARRREELLNNLVAPAPSPAPTIQPVQSEKEKIRDHALESLYGVMATLEHSWSH